MSSLIVLPPYNALTSAVLGTLSYKALKVDAESALSNNNVIKDSSSSGMVTSSVEGRPAQGSFSPFSPLGWQAKFNGASDALRLPSGTQTYNQLGTTWTVDCFVTFDALNAGDNHIWAYCQEPWGGATCYLRCLYNSTGKTLQVDEANTQIGLWWAVYSNFVPELGRVYHIAASRSGSTIRLFLDGVQVATATYADAHFADGTFALGAIYYRGNNQGFLNGKIANLRIRTGEVITANFAKPTSRQPLTSGTRFSFGNSGGPIDEGAYHYAITGSSSYVPQSPFNQSGEWSASTHGGSIYLDGVSDRWLYPGSAIWDLSAGFTFETWIYPLAAPSGAICRLAMFGANGLATSMVPLYINTNLTVAVGVPLTGKTAVTTPTTNPLKLNVWQHVAVSVLSNGTCRIFINGALIVTGTISMPTGNGTGNAAQFGWEPTGTVNAKFKGYLSDLRLSNTPRYTAAFTPPTAPLAVDGNTKLKLEFNNVAIIDRLGVTNLIENGLTTTNTIFKEGSKSVVCDGTKYMQAKLNTSIGTGDFTFSSWVYPTKQWGTQETFFSGQANGELLIYRRPNGQLALGLIAGSDLLAGGVLEQNVWQHIEVSRSGGTIRLFINGKIVASASNSTSITFSTNWYSMFCQGLATAGTFFSGYADLIEVAAGQAAHTSDFDSGFVSPQRYATFDAGEAGGTLSQGNLRVDLGGNGHSRSSLQVAKGKVYVEYKIESWNGRYSPLFGISPYNGVPSDNNSYSIWPSGGNDVVNIMKAGAVETNPDGLGANVGDIIGILYDADAGKLSFWVNERAYVDRITGIPTGQPYAFVALSAGGAYPCTVSANFGQNAYAYPERVTSGVTGLLI